MSSWLSVFKETIIDLRKDDLSAGPHNVKISNAVSSLNFSNGQTEDARNFIEVAEIGNNVTTLEESCFANCGNLSVVYSSPNLLYVGDYAFKNCSSFVYADFLDSGRTNPLVRIGRQAFMGSNLNFARINLKGGEWTGSSDDSSVGEEAFRNCKNLIQVQFTGANSIEDNVFEGCENLVSVEFNNRHSYFGSSAFKDCTRLKTIAIPPKTYMIPERTFQGCTRLRNIEFQEYEPSLVTYLGDYFISGCTSLTSLTLPASMDDLSYFSDNTFSGSSIKRLKLNGLTMADITLNLGGDETVDERTYDAR